MHRRRDNRRCVEEHVFADMTPLGLALTLTLAVMVFRLPRSAAATALIAGVCYITQGQYLHVAGFTFTAIRIVLLAGFIRVYTRGELKQIRRSVVDRALICYALTILVVSTIRAGTVAELVYQVGCLYNIFLSYFVLRALLVDQEAVIEVLSKVAYLIIPLAFLMFQESVTGRNFFAMFGEVGTMYRDGHYRSMGPFRSPITAGSFGATLAMLYSGMLLAGISRRRASVGLAASMLIMIAARSSGPVLGYAVGLLGITCWCIRGHMRKIRWGLALSILGLHLIMKAPVWFLLGRVSDIVGGGGYHRAYVIDQFINHFSSWWLLGTSNTGGWVATQLASGGTDITNQFVSDGLNGGLLGFILSAMLVVRCFQQIARAMEATETDSLAATKFAWGVGATLAGTIAILFSVTYFDQMHVIWYFLLAVIAALSPLIQERLSPEVITDEASGCDDAEAAPTL